jgi:RHS repeat-associated protein
MGRYYDNESSLMYCRYRYYNVILGRWLSRDPLLSNVDRNIYQYLYSNPISYNDPSGRCPNNPANPEQTPNPPPDIWIPVPKPDWTTSSGIFREYRGQWYRKEDRSKSSNKPQELEIPLCPEIKLIPSKPYVSSIDPFSPDYDPNTLLGLHNWELLYDFLSGTGSADRYYDSDTIQTFQMRQSPGAKKLREAFYNSGCKGVSTFEYTTKEAALETAFGPKADWSNTAFQVGGFDKAMAINNGNGTATFIIYNEASRSSFLYHGLYLFTVQNRIGGPLRTIRQTFVWSENITCCDVDLSEKAGNQPPKAP